MNKQKVITIAFVYMCSIIFIIWAIIQHLLNPDLFNPLVFKWQCAIVAFLTGDWLTWRYFKDSIGR